jgi:hypothetical protein
MDQPQSQPSSRHVDHLTQPIITQDDLAVALAWHQRRARYISTPLLCSSAIYLILRSNQQDSANELNNLRRIMHLLVDTRRPGREHAFHYAALAEALDAKVAPEFRGGLDVPVQEARAWHTRLKDPASAALK